MEITHTEIKVKGQPVSVPSARIEGRIIIVGGKWIKVAAVQDEELVEGEPVATPKSFLAQLSESGLRADLFTFAQNLTNTTPKHDYHLEWDNFAVIPITTYSEWWDKQAESSVRRAVRKAAKLGVVVKLAEFDDVFVQGIVAINNETPIRQERPFWHYRKSFEEVKKENSTYPGRNVFLGAYFNEELIGFIRMICASGVASIAQILSKVKHLDKRTTNALLAKAVEVCAERGIPRLMYCNYVYNNLENSLTEFKRRNGFQKVMVPRYYVPLTGKGRLALRLGLHRGIATRLPKGILQFLLKVRNSWYERRSRVTENAE